MEPRPPVPAPPSTLASGRLSPAQLAALQHVHERATGASPGALARLRSLLHRHASSSESGGSLLDPLELAARVVQRGRVTLNFHPDRLLADGRTVAATLLADGRYRSQFETGISNGSRTAFAGGERDGWERSLFGGAYQADGVLASERPRYGALELMGHADGAAPRFGSCHVQLRPATLARSTFCFGDSHLDPGALGTRDAFAAVTAELLEAVRDTGCSLGRPGMDVPSCLDLLLAPRPDDGAAPATHGRALDDYIEAQVHGDLVLAEDVERLVADPSFRGTETGEHLAAMAARHGFPLVWHPGFELAIDDVPDDFRGPAMPPLARRLQRELAAPGQPLDAALIGRAAASLHREPGRWRDRGTVDETLQHLKQLWHVLVHLGQAKTV